MNQYLSKVTSYPNKEAILACCNRYRVLLALIDRWFCDSLSEHKSEIVCSNGCSECCRALFDITLPDALLLREGFLKLPQSRQLKIIEKSRITLNSVLTLWNDFAPPYILNYRPESDWEILMPEDDETPCVFLDEKGECSVYEYRPMTCRLHGIPLIDTTGEVVYEDWCSLNFTACSPLNDMTLSVPFYDYFKEEVRILKELTGKLLGVSVGELDTFIPFAPLVDYENFGWKNWFSRVKLEENPVIV